MLRSEYPTTKVYRLIRGMESSSSSSSGDTDAEFWMVVDYWVGRSRGTGNPPFLSMSYRGGIQDGIM